MRSFRTSPLPPGARIAMGLAFFSGLATGLTGCPEPAHLVDAEWAEDQGLEEDLRRLIEEAVARYEAGDMAGSLALVEQARGRTDDPHVLAFLAIREAQIHLRRDDPEAALEALGDALVPGAGALEQRAELLEALALFEVGRLEDASDLLATVDAEDARGATGDPVLQSRLLVAAGHASLAAASWTQAALRFAEATADATPGPASIAAAGALLDAFDDATAALDPDAPPHPGTEVILSAIPAGGGFWAVVVRRAAREAIARFDLAAATGYVAALEQQGWKAISGPLRLSVESLRAELDSTNPDVVGAVLPLTGKNKGVGLAMKQGIETAARILGAEHPFDVVFLDSAGDPELARQHVRTLKEEHGAIAVIGPAAGVETAASAEEADAIGMPLVTLSLEPGVAAVSPWVFRNFSTHPQEAALLAGWTSGDAGIERIAVLHPDSTYGRGMTQIFTKVATERGAVVDPVVSYPPSETNFLEKAKEIASHGDVQALFVPGTSQQLALIAPALAYEKVLPSRLEDVVGAGAGEEKDGSRIVIVAPQVAYSPLLPGKAGNYLQGAVFSVGYFEQTTDPFGAFFATEFTADHGVSPGAPSAWAADALLLVAAAVTIDGVRTRSQLRDWLADPAAWEGDVTTVASFAGFEQSGDAAAPLMLVRLVDETFERLESP